MTPIWPGTAPPGCDGPHSRCAPDARPGSEACVFALCGPYLRAACRVGSHRRKCLRASSGDVTTKSAECLCALASRAFPGRIVRTGNFALEAAQSGEPVRVLGTLKREFHTSLARGPPPMITVPVELIWLAVTFTMVMAGFLAAASE